MIDLYGKLVHEWTIQQPTLINKLLKNGHLIVSQLTNIQSESPSERVLDVDRTPIIQELDWQGNVVWEYKNRLDKIANLLYGGEDGT